MDNSVSFDQWVAGDYLRDFYSEVQEDERQTIRYFVEQMRRAPRGPVLCFGSGPTLHHVFLAVPQMTELYLADYLPRNLAEIDRWISREPSAHNWDSFVRYTLFCESGEQPTDELVSTRSEAVRSGVTGLLHADAGLTDPLGPEFRGKFATVLSPYCADSATDDKGVWAQFSRNIASLVRPGGLMLTSSLRHCRQYRIGDRFFPAANIDERDIEAILKEDFEPDSIEVEVREVPEHRAQGYTGVILARSLKARAG